MSIDAIRSRAERLQRKVRRGNVIAVVALTLGIVGDAWQVWRSDVLLIRIGNVLTITAIMYVAYTLRDYVRSELMPAGLGLTASSAFYRKQLTRQRDAASQPWRILVPFIPGVALSLLGHTLDRSPLQSAVIAAFGVGLFLAVAWVNARTARRLQSEIDELG